MRPSVASPVMLCPDVLSKSGERPRFSGCRAADADLRTLGQPVSGRLESGDQQVRR
ncbi:MAG: hypothetical protein IJ904_02055 [Candidatus Methanomethylophilaceae archaeon]|nr:hypothetical protein [Candidatus Methanomethylophilaceae archaeon]